VNQVRARFGDRAHLLAEPREVSGKNTGGDAKRHGPRRVYNAFMAEEKLYEITVSAATQYLAEQSDEAAERFVFAYTITLRNTGNVAAQLISRHWIITDAQGLVQEVRGLGVVGAQPLLQPGESYEYTSGASIATAVGTMKGTYQMVASDGKRFEAPIPQFTLSVPRVLH
jgi:ApaG protein